MNQLPRRASLKTAAAATACSVSTPKLLSQTLDGTAHALTADPNARLVAISEISLDRIHTKCEAITSLNGMQVTPDDGRSFIGLDGYKHLIKSSDVVLIPNVAEFHPGTQWQRFA